MRPLNHSDYLLLLLVLISMVAGLFAAAILAWKLTEELRERRAEREEREQREPVAVPSGLPDSRANRHRHRNLLNPRTWTYSPNRRAAAANTAPGGRP